MTDPKPMSVAAVAFVMLNGTQTRQQRVRRFLLEASHEEAGLAPPHEIPGCPGSPFFAKADE